TISSAGERVSVAGWALGELLHRESVPSAWGGVKAFARLWMPTSAGSWALAPALPRDDTPCPSPAPPRFPRVRTGEGVSMTPCGVHHDAWEHRAPAAGPLPRRHSYAN